MHKTLSIRHMALQIFLFTELSPQPLFPIKSISFHFHSISFRIIRLFFSFHLAKKHFLKRLILDLAKNYEKEKHFFLNQMAVP